MKKLIFLVLLVIFLGLLPVAGQADTVMYDDRGDWEAALGIPVTDVVIPFDTGFTDVPADTGIPLPMGSVSFAQPTQCAQVGTDSAINWLTWSDGTPKVLYTNGLATVTATFTVGQMAFGLEMEPNFKTLESMTLDLGGGISLTQDVDGDGGALFFGWISDVGYTSMTLRDNATVEYLDNNGNPIPHDFAIGRMVSAVPVPASVLLLGSGLAGLGLLRARKRSKA